MGSRGVPSGQSGSPLLSFFFVGGTGVFVTVGVKVNVAVGVAVKVMVGVCVAVGVDVKVGVAVAVGVLVREAVGVGGRNMPPRLVSTARKRASPSEARMRRVRRMDLGFMRILLFHTRAIHRVCPPDGLPSGYSCEVR